MTSDRIVRIGGGAAFFVDSALYVPQLLHAGVDYIMLDYLAEGSMGLFGRALAQGENGYPPDFVTVHVGPHLQTIAKTGTRIVANAGALDPQGLATELREQIAEQGLDLKVAAISGDNLIDRWDELAKSSELPLVPEAHRTSLTAYLGAFPIAVALAEGADIVVTGRVVDSALVLGPLIHEFGWADDDWDRLAAGTVAGHLIECSGQVTGGTFTDWQEVEGWENIGAPIAECREDGSCVITKPEGTGGLVSFGTVAEQLLYEVGDPQAYHVPDVTADFTQVELEEIGPDRVRVSGAKGYPPTDQLKFCATWDDGWRAVAYQPVIGGDAKAKADKQGQAIIARTSQMLAHRQLPAWRSAQAIPFGGDDQIALKLVVEHDDMLPCQLFLREQLMAISAMAPGTSIGFGAQVQPAMRFMTGYLDKDAITSRIDGEPVAAIDRGGFDPDMIVRPKRPEPKRNAMQKVPIKLFAYARSGEKGEMISIAIIARQAEYLYALRRSLSAGKLEQIFPDLVPFSMQVFDVPGIDAFNIVLEGALPKGINGSDRFDPAAKSIAQRLLAARLD